MRPAPLGLFALVGCSGADLRGTWQGELDCDALVFDAVLTLDKREKGIFQGPLELHFEATNQDDLTLVTDAVYDAEARADKPEPQDLRFEADFSSLACEILDAGGTTVSTDCSDANITDADFESRENLLSAATWDGEGTITVDVEDGCTGDLDLTE